MVKHIYILLLLAFSFGNTINIPSDYSSIQEGIDVASDGDDAEENDPFIIKSDELPYLFSAFFITWIVLFAYIFIIARDRKEIESELYTLKNSLEENNSD